MKIKRKLLVAALVASGANAAYAQSSVTLYGEIDLEVGKYDGSTAIRENTGATSRWGLKGTEDLGGGLHAIFQLEQQFNPNDGTLYNSSSFFSGRSIVGLEGGFGRFVVGRDINASHYVEVTADPFGQDGLVAGYGARGGISEANGGPGQIDTVRTNNSANYSYVMGPVTFRGQVATRDSSIQGGNIPYAGSIVYENPKLKFGVSYINPQHVNDHWAYTAGQYDMGFARFYAGYGFGQNTFSQEIHNQMAGVLIPVTATGAIKASYSHTTANGMTIQSRTALAYFYFLSKATSLYVDAVYDTRMGAFNYGTSGWQETGTTQSGSGCTVGIRHFF
jgi:predicted porin